MKKKFKWKPYKKFMFVEEGSIETNELILELEKTNPEIKVIVYRMGARQPELIDIKKKGE